jgi:hypothetical protein
LEGVKVCVFGSEGAEGECGVEVLKGVVGLGAEDGSRSASEFVEGEAERFFEGCAEVLGDGFVGDEEREEVGFGEWREREVVGGAGVGEAVAVLVVLDGKAEAVLHELDVAKDGALGGFEFGSECGRGRAGTGFDALVDEEDALPMDIGLTDWNRLSLTLSPRPSRSCQCGEGVLSFGISRRRWSSLFDFGFGRRSGHAKSFVEVGKT